MMLCQGLVHILQLTVSASLCFTLVTVSYIIITNGALVSMASQQLDIAERKMTHKFPAQEYVSVDNNMRNVWELGFCSHPRSAGQRPWHHPAITLDPYKQIYYQINASLCMLSRLNFC